MKNRIKGLFKGKDLRDLNWKQITEIIRKGKGSRFFINNTEANWLTNEKLKPSNDTIEFINSLGKEVIKL